MRPLSSKAQSVLDAARRGQGLDPARMAANLETLNARMLAGEMGPDVDVDLDVNTGTAGSSTAGTTAVKVIVVLVVAGAIAFALRPGADPASTSVEPRALASAEQRDETTAEGQALPLATRSPSQSELEATTSAADRDDDSELPTRSPTARSSANPNPDLAPNTQADTQADTSTSKTKPILPAKIADSPIDRLEAEMALMSEARRALGRGDSAHALKLLDRHGREFPHGEFRKERSVSRVTALCALGRRKDATAVAARYLAKDSSSVHAQRIQQSCAIRTGGASDTKASAPDGSTPPASSPSPP